MPELFVAKKPQESSQVGLFSSFVQNPANISFHHQEKDEKIILFLRRHFITNLDWILISVFLTLLPIPFFIFGFGNLPFPALPGNFTFVLTLIYYLFIFSFAFYNFLIWYFNILIVTQKRVIDIDFAELVFHDVAETRYNLLQDINYTQTGSIRNLFNYGDVFAQTAGGKENIEALAVPKPAKVTDIITSFMGRTTERMNT